MNTRAILTSLAKQLAPLRKDGDPSMPSGPTDPTGALPSDGGSPTGEPASVLAEVAQKLGAILKQVQDGGEMPEGIGEQLKALAGELLALVPKGEAEPGVGGPGVGAVPSMDKAALGKALDAYTEAKVTLDAACSRLYGAQDLMRLNKVDEALAELQGVTTMIQGISSQAGGAAGQEKAMTTKSVTMTPAEFVGYAMGQLKVAATEKIEKALPRLTHLSKAVERVAKMHFEDDVNGKTPAPLSIEIEEAYAGTGGGTKEDLTSIADQKTTEPSMTDTGSSQDSAMAANAMEVLGKAVSALAAQFDTKQTPGTPTAAAAGGATAFAKSATQAELDAWVWPHDLASKSLDDPPAATTRVAKRAAEPIENWGADPQK